MITERNATHRLHNPGDQEDGHSHNFEEVSVVSFDAAGTLITPYPSVGAVYTQALRRHGIAADCSEIEERFRKSLKRNQATVRSNLNNDTERDFWHRIVWDTIGEFCPDGTFSTIFDELYEDFASGSRWQLAPDARETLAELDKRRYRIALLSNSDSRMRRVLAELNIDHFFRRDFSIRRDRIRETRPPSFPICRERTVQYSALYSSRWRQPPSGCRGISHGRMAFPHSRPQCRGTGPFEHSLALKSSHSAAGMHPLIA